MSSDTQVSPPPTFGYSDFTTVKSKKKRNRPHIKETPSLSIQLSKLREQLKQDQWFEVCSQLLQSSWEKLVKGGDSPASILCLGLGSPTTSLNARVQLAFLTEVCELLKVPTDTVSIYDPVFTPEDVSVLNQLRMKVLSESNTSQCELTRPTLCFMPHCDIELYEALLQTNANLSNDDSATALTNLFLVGNGLREYIDNKPKRVMEADFPCILHLAPYLECTPLPTSSAWPTAFNNTSIQFVRCSSSDPEVRDGGKGNIDSGSGSSGSEAVGSNDEVSRHTGRQRECSPEADERLKGGAGGGDNYGTQAPLGIRSVLPDEGRADRGVRLEDNREADVHCTPDVLSLAPRVVHGKVETSSGLQYQQSKKEQMPAAESRATPENGEERERGDENSNQERDSEREENMPSEMPMSHGESLVAVLQRLQDLKLHQT